MTPQNTDSNQYISAWVALTKGEFYKIEGYMIEWGGAELKMRPELEKPFRCSS